MRTEMKLDKKQRVLFLVVGAMLLLLIFLFSSLTVVNQTEVGVYTNFGRYVAQFDPGVNFRAPFTSAVYKYDTRIQVSENTYEAYTWDTQTVTYILNVQYQLDKTNIYQVFLNFGTMEQLANKIAPMFYSESKNIFKQYSASKRELTTDLNGDPVENEFNEVIQKRDEIEVLIGDKLKEMSALYFIDIINVRIMDIAFSAEYETAIEEKQVAYQNFLAEKNKALALIEKAKGEANALIEKARGEAEAKVLTAEAEAEILEIMRNAWNEVKTAGVEELVLQQMFIDSWDGVLPQTWLSEDVLSAIFTVETPEP